MCTKISQFVLASISVDRAYESLLNCIFYISLFFCSMSVTGAFDALSVALAIASIAVSFSFVIGSACSTIFEGILMILIRRPYGEWYTTTRVVVSNCIVSYNC